MRFSEILRLVFINLIQNKFKVILTSIGIVVGAATIVLVIAIGRGGQMDVADQFQNLNAGAIDISYSMASALNQGRQNSSSSSGGFVMPGGSSFIPGSNAQSSGSSGGTTSTQNSSSGNKSSTAGNTSSSAGKSNTVSNANVSANANGNSASSGNNSGNSGSQFPNVNSQSGGQFPNANSQFGSQFPGGMQGFQPGANSFFPGGSQSGADTRINLERITLSSADVDDLETFVSGITDVSISYSTKSTVDGGDLEAATSYTIGGVKSDYDEMSNLEMAIGEFITESNTENAEKVCILGASVAKEIFGSVTEAYDSIIYIDDRPYVVNGVLQAMGTVTSGISPDTAIFIPYETGIKYIAGPNVSPTITVIASDVNNVAEVITNVKQVLAESYPNASFTITDAGSKMEAASASNRTLTLLLFAMAAIVFVVGGIGIMNVLFVSVKERTKEIGILKSIGCRKRDILLEFLFEACFISVLGGILGVAFSFLITPVIKLLSVRVELSVIGAILAICFAIITGTAFGFYPALKASKLIPVQALSDI